MRRSSFTDKTIARSQPVDCGQVQTNAFRSCVKRSSQRPLAFTRNDLLFTMSDNTQRHEHPWWARNADANMFSDEPDGSFSDVGLIKRALRSKADRDHRWWSQTGSNRRPPACKAGALPTELWPRSAVPQQRREMVGLGRFELPTSRLSSARSNQLSYRPNRYPAHV